jgi:hypothetical protein
MRTEAEVRRALTAAHYKRFIKDHRPVKLHEYWDDTTGSCGLHANFVLSELGLKEDGEFEEVRDIDTILKELEKGHVLTFLHNYTTDAQFLKLPKDNRYGNHMFTLLKGGSKYFMTQAYLHKYGHSLRVLTRAEVAKMLDDILHFHSDYDTTKTWADIDISLHKKYFGTELRLWPNLPVQPHRKVHGIRLFVEHAR